MFLIGRLGRCLVGHNRCVVLFFGHSLHCVGCRLFLGGSDCFLGFGAGHLEGEVTVLGSYAATIVAELVAEDTSDGEVIVRKAFDFLAEHHLAAERLNHAAEHLVHLLVRLGLGDFADALVVGALGEGELDCQRAVGRGVLRVEMPAVVELGGEDQLGLGGRGLLDAVAPLHGVELLGLYRIEN